MKPDDFCVSSIQKLSNVFLKKMPYLTPFDSLTVLVHTIWSIGAGEVNAMFIFCLRSTLEHICTYRICHLYFGYLIQVQFTQSIFLFDFFFIS